MQLHAVWDNLKENQNAMDWPCQNCRRQVSRVRESDAVSLQEGRGHRRRAMQPESRMAKSSPETTAIATNVVVVAAAAAAVFETMKMLKVTMKKLMMSRRYWIHPRTAASIDFDQPSNFILLDLIQTESYTRHFHFNQLKSWFFYNQ